MDSKVKMNYSKRKLVVDSETPTKKFKGRRTESKPFIFKQSPSNDKGTVASVKLEAKIITSPKQGSLKKQTPRKERLKKKTPTKPNLKKKASPLKKALRKKTSVKKVVKKKSPTKQDLKEITFIRHSEAIEEPKFSKEQVQDQLEELTTKLSRVPRPLVQNVVKLFDEECTIPFIARYRKHLIGDLLAEDLRHLKYNLKLARSILARRSTIIKQLAKSQQLTSKLLGSLYLADTLEDLEFIYSPFKPAKKNRFADAINLGLQPIAEKILNGVNEFTVDDLLNPDIDDLRDEGNVQELLKILIAYMVSNDPDVVKKLQEMKYHYNIRLISNLKKGVPPNTENGNFENYYSFNLPWQRVMSHMFLAIDRGVARGILTSKIDVGPSVKEDILQFVTRKWMSKGCRYDLRTNLVVGGVEVAFKKHIEPFLRKNVTIELKEKAERGGLEDFADNLKWILLEPPIRGQTILAIDPGFYNGCKIAIVSPAGAALHTDTLFITTQKDKAISEKLVAGMREHGVTLVAVGNGKGNVQVKKFMRKLINTNFPDSDIPISEVREEGVSVYSCSTQAKDEFPDMDPNHISAISLARRVQDPVSELVKVEPHHLGVGMYQHDMSGRKLCVEVEEVVSQNVSAIGADLNTASLQLLRYISGLSENKAKSIIEWRNENGCFATREQIKEVKGIGEKTFQYCAGFLRIRPDTAVGVSREQMEILDQTEIHPELYSVTKTIVKKMGLSLSCLGKPDFIKKADAWINTEGMHYNCQNVSKENLSLIYNTLKSNLGEDVRTGLKVCTMELLPLEIEGVQVGSTLKGKVTNVTHFGAFVDVGLERHGLIPKRYLHLELHWGQMVEVKVINKELTTKKVTLQLEKII